MSRDPPPEEGERDPLLGERIVWSGRPRTLQTPGPLRAAAAVLWVLAAVALCFAVVVALGLGAAPGALLLFAMWSASLALACVHLPRIWLEGVRYIVTERHVVLERGRYRRTIERRAISFARIHWSSRAPGTGTLDLVRAVPTGALRRRLLLQLRGVAAPDQVWAIIRGVEAEARPSDGGRLLAQRLELGEQVLWSARPSPTILSFRPQGRREWATLALALVMLVTFGVMLKRFLIAWPALTAAGLAETPLALVALAAAELLALLLVLGLAAYFGYAAVVAPMRLLAGTRYLITNRRVLIQRGREELQLDRSRIVDVIPTPASKGLTDVFLVLDGPRARALSMSGAFGEAERSPALRPVLQAVRDAEMISRILLGRAASSPRGAA